MDGSAEQRGISSPSSRFLGGFFGARSSGGAEEGVNRAPPNHIDNAQLSRGASLNTVGSPTESISRLFLTPTTRGPTESPMPCSGNGNSERMGSPPPHSAALASPSSNAQSPGGGQILSNGNNGNGKPVVVSPTSRCAALMSGYRQCMEVNPDAKVNCTWALDKYMQCRESND